MTASVSLSVSGLTAVEHFMDALVAKGADTRVLMERIGIVGETSVSDNFEGEHGPDGAPWKPSHRAKTKGGKTLTDSGILNTSIESHATTDGVEIGSNLIYAPIHQFGGTITGNPRLKFNIPGIGFVSPESVTIPARPFLGWGADALEEVDAQATDWLAEVLPAGSV